MKNLTLMILLLIGIFSATGCSNQDNIPEKITIGIVNLTPTVEVTIEGFKDGLNEHGYKDGQNVQYLYEGPVAKMEAIDGTIQKVLSQKPDLILSLLTPVTQKLKEATSDSQTPIIFGPVGDPVSAGIVADLKAPGENLSGVRVSGTEQKALDWFKRIVPDLDTLLVPYNPDAPAMVIALKNLQKEAEGLGVNLIVREIRSRDDLNTIFTQIPPEVDGIWTLGSGFWAPFVDEYIQLAIDSQLPLKGTTADWCRRGALFSFSEDLYQLEGNLLAWRWQFFPAHHLVVFPWNKPIFI